MKQSYSRSPPMAMTATAKLAAPVLLVSLAIGLFVGLDPERHPAQRTDPRVRAEVHRLSVS